MISTVEKVLFLKGVDLFRELPGAELSHIAQIAEEVEHGQDETIFNEGDDGDAMYLIVDGKVKVHSGKQVFAELGEKQCVGEMAILDSEPRSASVTSVSDSLLMLRIGREEFAEILAEKPQISQGIIRTLTRRLREANKR